MELKRKARQKGLIYVTAYGVTSLYMTSDIDVR